MLFIIALLLVLLLVLLTVPVTVTFRAERIREISGYVIFHGLFGVVRYRYSIPGEGQNRPGHKRSSRKKTGKRGAGKKMRGVSALLKQAPFRRRLLRFSRDLLGAIQARDLYLRLRIGLGDPADTGRLWGFLGPAAGIAATLRSVEVHLEPEFADPVLEIESHGEVHFIPLRFIGLAMAFVVSPAAMRAWFTLRRSNA